MGDRSIFKRKRINETILSINIEKELIMFDPISLLYVACLFGCAFMAGKAFGQDNKDQTIEETILYLAENGFLEYTKTRDGELEIHKIYE